MQIWFLGHSEFILEMENNSGRTVRILCDSWLSNHAFGDFLARNPPLEIDFDSFPRLDAIYLTHPHCDHFDPYTLVEIFQKQRPAILLPETSSFLIPLLKEYLSDPEIFILRHAQKSRIFGLNIRAHSFYTPYHTNEDDVMMLFIHNDKEAFFYEADAALPEDPAAHETVYSLFTEANFTNRVYVATRNELEALFTSYDATDPRQRKHQLADYRRKRREEMEWEYAKFDEEYVPYPELTMLSGLIRILVGQGIVFPPEINDSFLKISAPFPLTEVAFEERKVAKEAGRKLTSEAQEPGQKFTIINGQVTQRENIGEGIKINPFPLAFDNRITIPLEGLKAPLRKESRDTNEQKQKILNCINNRFLPYQLASLEDPLQKAMSESGKGAYSIRVKYGKATDPEIVDYVYSFESLRFEAQKDYRGKIDEEYWANDLDDFLEGTQDLFSNSLDRFEPGTQRRLWNMLGMPFITSDLVYKKIKYHFERASRGEKISPWVLAVGLENRPGSEV